MSGQYWSESWSPVRGCSGQADHTCKARCWAAGMAHRLAANPATRERYDGLTCALCPGPSVRYPAGQVYRPPRWTGRVRFDTATLAEPLHWRKPRVVLGPSLMGDLFDPQVTDEQIAAVYGVMAACPQHEFLVLTKRASRLAACPILRWGRIDLDRVLCDYGLPQDDLGECPLPHVLLGVSVCDQADADERMPHLARLAAAGWRTWVSIEPLLGPVNLGRLAVAGYNPAALAWAVIGAETGPRPRRCDSAWIDSLLTHLGAAGVPVWVKAAPARADGREWPRERPELAGLCRRVL